MELVQEGTWSASRRILASRRHLHTLSQSALLNAVLISPVTTSTNNKKSSSSQRHHGDWKLRNISLEKEFCPSRISSRPCVNNDGRRMQDCISARHAAAASHHRPPSAGRIRLIRRAKAGKCCARGEPCFHGDGSRVQKGRQISASKSPANGSALAFAFNCLRVCQTPQICRSFCHFTKQSIVSSLETGSGQRIGQLLDKITFCCFVSTSTRQQATCASSAASLSWPPAPQPCLL